MGGELIAYGTRAHTAAQLAGCVSDRSGLAFEEHDSDYRGLYFVAESAFGGSKCSPTRFPATMVGTISTTMRIQTCRRSC